MTSIKWALCIKWALSPLFSYSWTDSKVRQSKCWEKKKDPASEVQHGSDLSFQRRQEVWNQRNGPERRGGGEERVVHKASDLSSRGGHHQAVPHGQASSASGSRRDVRINGNMTRAPVAPVSCLWCTEIHHRAAPEGREISQPSLLLKVKFRWGIAVLDCTEKGKFTLVPCHRVQPFPISNHSAKSCLVCAVRSEPKWLFLAYALKTKLKKLIYVGQRLLI